MTWNVDSTIGDGGQCTDFWLQESSVFRILADYHISLSFKENQLFVRRETFIFVIKRPTLTVGKDPGWLEEEHVMSAYVVTCL